MAKAVKKPRAKNAEDMFAEEHQDDIREALKSRRLEEGMDTKEGNLKLHRLVKKEMFFKLPVEDRNKYEKMSDDHKAKIKEAPPREHVFE